MDHHISVKFVVDANPQFTFDPVSVNIPNKEHAKLFWNISNDSSPGTQFAPTDGIVFKPSAPGYPGSTPSAQNGKVYVSTEFNDNPGPEPHQFPYVANVLYNGRPYQSPDPDVTNDPPPHGGQDHEHDHHGHGSHHSGDKRER